MRTTPRIIAYLDVDCFEVQVRGRQYGYSQHSILTTPMVCVNTLEEVNCITSVNHPAKVAGIGRGPRHSEAEARRTCPDVVVLTSPMEYGKPEKLSLKEVGDDIYDCIVSTLERIVEGENIPTVEKCTNDEVYIDLTEEIQWRMDSTGGIPLWTMKPRKFLFEYRSDKVENPFATFPFVPIVGMEMGDSAFFHAGKIIAEILDSVRTNMGYVVSGGVANNKMLAKMACGAAKPNGLAMYSLSGFKRLRATTLLNKIPGLGGQTGLDIMNEFEVETIQELSSIPCMHLEDFLGNCELAHEIKQKSNGIDESPVIEKNLLPKWTCGISFPRIASEKGFRHHVYNRFYEMGDYLIYDFQRNGRVPHFLQLEVELDDYYNNVAKLRIEFPPWMIHQLQCSTRNCQLLDWRPTLRGCDDVMMHSRHTEGFMQPDGTHCYYGYRLPRVSHIKLIAHYN